MAFNVREGFWGLEHLRLGFCRKLFKMKVDAFMPRYQGKACRVEVLTADDGAPKLCARCGFVKMKAIFDSGWQMEMCSALPLVSLDNPVFKQWQLALAAGPSDNAEPKVSKTDLQEEAILQD